MKTIVLSFDDGRFDTYEYAFKAMKEYEIPGSVYVTTGFVFDNTTNENLNIKSKHSLTPNNIIELYKSGWEVGCHGRNHTNQRKDLLDNIRDLEKIGINTKKIGFASPFSEITMSNNPFLKELKNGILLYVRSGIQTRRENIIYVVLSLVNSLVHSDKIYCRLNRKCVIHSPNNYYLSVGIKKNDTIHEIMALIENEVKDDDALVLNFHSILPYDHEEYGVDKWTFELDKFKKLLYLLYDKNINFMTLKDYTTKSVE